MTQWEWDRVWNFYIIWVLSFVDGDLYYLKLKNDTAHLYLAHLIGDFIAKF